VLRDHPARAVHPAGLLVGEERQHQVAVGDHAAAGVVPGHGDQDGGVALHVHRAAAVQHAVVDLGTERRVGPVRGVGRDHVQVRVRDQRAAVGVRAGQPDHQVAPTRAGLRVLRPVAHLDQAVVQEPGGARLAVADRLRVAGVGAVDADQRPGELDGLVLQPAHAVQIRLSSAVPGSACRRDHMVARR
jgi:hypothetical protein